MCNLIIPNPPPKRRFGAFFAIKNMDKYPDMSKNIIAIHGAFSTPTIYNYLKRELSEFDWNFVDYSNITSNINKLITQILHDYENTKKRYHVVGHSMGGLMALGLAGKPWVASITTIATPLDGLEINLLQNYLSRSSFLGEISTYSDFLKNIHEKKYTMPIQHIISTQGFNPYIWEPNDGVVTLRSQRGWKSGATHDVSANHTEIMMTPETVKLLATFWSIK